MIYYNETDQEKKWQAGNGKLMRDFATFKDFYSNKLMNQEQSTKQLRKKQKELNEEYGARTNQKTIFNNLFALLDAKKQCEESLGNDVGMGGPGSSLDRSNSNRYFKNSPIYPLTKLVWSWEVHPTSRYDSLLLV